MQRFLRFFPSSILLALLICCPQANATITASLPEALIPRAGEWQMLSVNFSDEAGMASQVGVRDARGGPEICRNVAVGESSVNRNAIVSLPLLDPEMLAGDRWPVEIVVRDANGKILDRDIASLSIHANHPQAGDGAGGASRLPLRWGYLFGDVPKGASPSISQRVTSLISPDPLESRLAFPEIEISFGPALEFASLDNLVIPENARQNISEERMLALMTAGVRIVAPGQTSPGPPDSRLLWQREKIGNGTAWTAPALPLRRPTVIEPGLSDLVAWRKPATATPHDEQFTLWLGPAAILIVILVRGLFRSNTAVLIGWTLGLSTLACTGIFYARSTASDLLHDTAWTQTLAPPPDADTGGAVTLRESFHVYSPLFAHAFHITSNPGELLLPVAASAREYWNLRDVRLILNADDNGTMVLDASLPARGVLCYKTISATAGAPSTALSAPLPTFPENPEQAQKFAQSLDISLADGWWIAGGYISPATGPFPDPNSGTLLTQWANGRPPQIRDAINTWYALRFEASGRYFLWQPKNPNASEAPIHLIAVPNSETRP